MATAKKGVLAIGIAIGLAAGASAATAAERFCSSTAALQFHACKSEVTDDFLTAGAICSNVVGEKEREDCLDEARLARREANGLCHEQRRARRALCEALGEDRYEPDFDPAHFDDDFGSLTQPHPYFPLAIGNHWDFAGGGESVAVEVLDKTKRIQDVTCVVVSDRVQIGGVLHEDTDDWYGQRKDGGVVYCGESVRNLESFAGDDPEEPELVDVDGSWKAGRDGSLPGTQFPASLAVGMVYRQEWSPGNAEDAAAVLSTSYAFGSDPELDAHVPQGLAELLCAAADCVVTGEFTPIEPDAFQHKYYARGIGLFLEVNPDSGDIVQLVGCNFDPRCAALPQP